MKNKVQLCIASFIIGCAVSALFTMLLLDNKSIKNDSELAEIKECRNILEEKGIDGFDDYKAINGYFNAGLDQFTGIIRSEDNNSVAYMINYVNTSGTAIASGFEIDCSESGNILLTNVVEKKAAYKSGLRTNDEIVMIDGVDVCSSGFENIANKLMGKQDTEVELTVLRNGKQNKVVFKRDNIQIRDVDWKNIDNVGYIKISGFDSMSDLQLSKALSELSGYDSYILDLRQNGGGNIEKCSELLRFFSPGIKIVLHGSKTDDVEYVVESSDKEIEGKIVVLVDSGTASSAEVVTAAVKQCKDNVTVVGSRTYGKGIYQNKVKISTGDYFSYTAGYFTVGDWECWQGKGIDPDVEVEMDPALIGTDDDIQLKEALKLLD